MSRPPSTFPWPATLTSDRLVLRPIEPDDIPAMRRLWTDPDVRRHLGGPVDKETLRVREQHCAGARGAFSVTLRTDGTVMTTPEGSEVHRRSTVLAGRLMSAFRHVGVGTCVTAIPYF